MVKEYVKIMVERIVLSKTTCDRCREDCTNTHFDIGSKASFCDKYDLIETICYRCYEKSFRQIVIDQRDKKVQRIIKSILHVESEHE